MMETFSALPPEVRHELKPKKFPQEERFSSTNCDWAQLDLILTLTPTLSRNFSVSQLISKLESLIITGAGSTRPAKGWRAEHKAARTLGIIMGKMNIFRLCKKKSWKGLGSFLDNDFTDFFFFFSFSLFFHSFRQNLGPANPRHSPLIDIIHSKLRRFSPLLVALLFGMYTLFSHQKINIYFLFNNKFISLKNSGMSSHPCADPSSVHVPMCSWRFFSGLATSTAPSIPLFMHISIVIFEKLSRTLCRHSCHAVSRETCTMRMFIMFSAEPAMSIRECGMETRNHWLCILKGGRSKAVTCEGLDRVLWQILWREFRILLWNLTFI